MHITADYPVFSLLALRAAQTSTSHEQDNTCTENFGENPLVGPLEF
jgi:hypothetical protein